MSDTIPLPFYKVWLLASRPKTLPAAIVPVTIGTIMAYRDNGFHWLSALLCLIAALFIQVVTNFINDWGDFKKGTDNLERIGPLRVTQAGLVTPGQMKKAIGMVFLLTILSSLYLVYRGGWPIVLIGVFSLISAGIYTMGPYPLGYVGLGDIFVFMFFGPVAVGGTYYVQTLTLNGLVILAGFSPGLISVAILTINNLRDIKGDKESGKKTLAVRMGRTFSQYEYAYTLLLACIIPPFIALMSNGKYLMTAIAMLTLLFIPAELKVIFSETDGALLNQSLARTGKILLVYGLLFSLGCILS